MPVFLRLLTPRRLWSLAILAAIVVGLALSGVLPSLHPGHSAHAFDDGLLADEPLQMGDVRTTLHTANVTLERGDWSATLRLIRFARSQWESFIPQMHASYQTYSWSQSDIDKATETWTYAIDQVRFRNLTGVRRSLATLESIMNRYRLPLAD